MNALSLPTLPTWDNLHPLIVHFPIVLLTIAGLPLLLSIVWHKQRTTMLFIAATLLVMGTIGAFLALSSGEASEHSIPMPREMRRFVHEHEEMAELTRNVFIVVTILTAGLSIAAFRIRTKPKAKFVVVGCVLMLLGYVFGALALANTGHLGALLVHKHGLHANLDNSVVPEAPSASGSSPSTPTPAAANEHDEVDDR